MDFINQKIAQIPDQPIAELIEDLGNTGENIKKLEKSLEEFAARILANNDPTKENECFADWNRVYDQITQEDRYYSALHEWIYLY